MLIICKQCGSERFDYPSNKRKFCSKKCWNKYWTANIATGRTGMGMIEYTCKICGVIFNDQRSNKRKMCGECSKKITRFKKGENTGNKNNMWKGGKININGYTMIYNPITRRYKQEHRLIMEEYIGRKIKSHECVHHINKIKTDNRVENMVVITKNEHIKIHRDDLSKGKLIKVGYLE